jgi:putative ABC transport system permease protein
MGILRLSFAKIVSRPLNAAISIVLFAIGIGIISLIVNIEQTVKEQFRRNLAGIDLVAGAKGSPLQLILSTVFHIDTPTGNISLNEAEQIGRNPMVEKTIPLALGDNYRGFRIVGTTAEYGKIYNAALSSGKWFENAFEAVVGADAASRTGLTIGEQFTGRHGFTDHGHHHDEDFYTVQGILKPTGTIIDQLILTTVDTYWLIHKNHGHTEGNVHIHSDECDHEHEEGNHKHDGHVHDENCDHDHDDEEANWQELIAKMDAREELSAEEMALLRERSGQIRENQINPETQITALLIFYSTPRAAIQLPRIINDNTNMQAASPAFETHRLFSLIGRGFHAVRWLAWIIIAISGINLFIHLANTLNQSIHEVALIRALGANRIKVMALLILQGIWLAMAGWALGIIVAKTIFILVVQSNVPAIGTFSVLTLNDLILLAYALLAGILASLPPAIKAYLSDIHYILGNE